MRSPTSIIRVAALAACAGLLAGCETTNPGPFAMAPAGMTHTRAAADCWMATEKVAQKMNLDKRADLVNVCIDKKMRGEPFA
jgi:hypothetical protein